MGAEGQRYVGRHLDSSSVAIDEENYSTAVPSIFSTGSKSPSRSSPIAGRPVIFIHSVSCATVVGLGSRPIGSRPIPASSGHGARSVAVWRSSLAVVITTLRDLCVTSVLTDSSPSCGVSAVLPREKSTVRNWPDACNTRAAWSSETQSLPVDDLVVSCPAAFQRISEQEESL